MSESKAMGAKQSNLGFTDCLSFGKYREKTVEKIFASDIPYLVWLREERNKQGENLFSVEVEDAIRKETIIRPHLLKKYPNGWSKRRPESSDTPLRADREATYAEEWGAF